MILPALKDYYDRVAGSEPGKVPPYGYSFEQIDHVLVLSREGNAIGLEALPARRQYVPLVERTSGIKPKFLWDNTSYIFGVSQKSKRSEREHAAFKEFHLGLLRGSEDVGLRALIAFLQDWHPEHYAKLTNGETELDTNLIFRLEGDLTFLHQREAAQCIWQSYLQSEWGKEGSCLITGEVSPIAELHPSVGGVRGAQTSGAYLVSFNLDAFGSYGLKNGENAPVGETATFQYTAALNTLLAKGSRNRIQIAGTTTVFWAEATEPEQSARADSLVAGLFNPPEEDDRSEIDPHRDQREAAKIRTALQAMSKGRPIRQILRDLDLDEGTRTFVLGLSPNAARLSVRFWHQDTLGQLAQYFEQHWQDLYIEPVPWKTLAPAIPRLLVQTAPRADWESIPSNLAGEVMRAILTGQSYPRSLFTAALMRCRAEQTVTGLRAAILKACLVRNREDVSVSLNRDNPNPGYRLGRLFAVLDAAQRTGIGKVNAGVRDKYIGAASATPARVFPQLLRGSQNHLSSARKKGKEGRAIRLEKEAAQIIDGLDAEAPFPTTLSMNEQGLFFVGFYHQQSELFVPRERGETVEDQDDPATTEE